MRRSPSSLPPMPVPVPVPPVVPLFLPSSGPEHPLARRGLAQVAAVAIAAGAALLVVGAAHARLHARLDEQRIVIAAQRASMLRLPVFAEEDVVVLRSKRDRITGQLQIFDKLDRARRGVVPALDLATRGHMQPPGPGDSHTLWVTSYRESGGSAYITGGAIDNADISKHMRDLQKDAQFSDVQLCFTKCSSPSDPALPWYPFEIGMKVDYAL